jgi:pimeloyl-ACP methyl ester carboxylesterase
VRAAAEYAAARRSWSLIERWPHGDGHPVLVLPGFLAGEESTAFLRRVLRRLDYEPYDWGQARNFGLRPHMEDALQRLLRDVTERHGRRASIIGWSAGGIYGREVARRDPDRVRSVITLGSPFRGNPRANHAWRLYSLLNRGPHAVEAMSHASRIAREQPLPVPTTCVFSRTDGIVAWECCTSHPSPTTENVEVISSHLGFGHNLETLYVIADRLAQPEGSWRPLARSRLGR